MKCCRGSQVLSSLEQARWRRAAQQLRFRLGEFADGPDFAWEAARAQDLYLGCLDINLFSSYDSFTMERCFEWFIFDFELLDKMTVIDCFLEKEAGNLGDLEVTLLKDWAASCISLYRIEEIVPGRGYKVRNLLYREELFVREPDASGEIEAGSVLLIRVLKVGGEYEFSTSGLVVPGECRDSIVEKIRNERRAFLQKNRTKSRKWKSYLKEQAHRINSLVMDLGNEKRTAANNSPAGESGKCKDVLAVNGWQDVLAIISGSEVFGLIKVVKDGRGAFRHATAAIFGEFRGQRKPPEVPAARPELEEETSVSGEARLRTVLGHLTLTTRFMVVTAVNPELLAECKRIAEEYFGGLIEEKASRKHKREDAPGEGDVLSWPSPRYAIVAGMVREELEALGCNTRQLRSALKLWFDYCSKERPSIRKTAVWTAAVIYTFAWMEMKDRLKQQELAWRHGVASSTISSRFRQLCKSLGLKARDMRYSTEKPPVLRPPESSPPNEP
ncbi:MAG TPA: hypothetical protein PK728_07255 [Bacillota bacterium]|nr:hypothetical protein [Bacillota bacterium]